MRLTNYLWWCNRGHKNTGSNRSCVHCGQSKVERYAQVHSSERAVVYYNPATGEHRTPARADVPMPEVYQRQGFERRELLSMLSWEKESGVVHEATNFNSGNEIISDEPIPFKPSFEVKKKLVQDIADAAASGPWTGADKLL